MRSTRIGFLVASLIALGACTPAASAASNFRPRIGRAMGLIPIHGQQETAIATSVPVVYHGGFVMRNVHIHTVFWAPSGYSFDGAPPGSLSYKALIQQFLTDTAHDSGSASNVFSTLGEYPDRAGSAGYNITYNPAVDSIDATDAYPVPGRRCASPSGIAVCITDLQLQHELDRVIGARDPSGRGLHDMWFILLPPNVDTCVTAGACGTNSFAGYHSLSNLGHGATIYASIPDPLIEFTPPPGTDPQGNPEAESAIDVIAHELMEAVTDPEGAGWMDSNGFEVADKCENGPQQGTPLGYAANGSAFNQVINGNRYFLQTSWSNTTYGCVQSSTSTSSALPLATVNLRQYSPSVSGNIGTNTRGVQVLVLVNRGGTVVAGAAAQTNARGDWGPVTLTSSRDGRPEGVGDDREEILVEYGNRGPKPDLIQTGDPGNPFTEAGWTGWFDLDYGYAVHARSVDIAPCGQTGVLALRVNNAPMASPIEQCETETDVATIQTPALKPSSTITLASQDNRAVTLDNPAGALIRLTVGLGEPGSTGAAGNPLIPFAPTGFPQCTANLRTQLVSCSGLVGGARYSLTRSRRRVDRAGRADEFGIARFGHYPGTPGITGGDVLALTNASGRTLTTLRVAHLRVAIKGQQTVIASGSCEPGDFYGPPLSSPPTSASIGVPGVAGDGTICPMSGKAAGLPTGAISQVDDRSGGQTQTQVPMIESTAPIQDATLYGAFVATTQVGLPGANGSTVPVPARVSLTITPAGSRHVAFRAANVNTSRGVAVSGLAPGSYRAKWVLSDANGDTRTIQTQFVQER